MATQTKERGGRSGLNAVGYLRRSTDRQEQSIPDQKMAVEAYAAEQGLDLVRFYTDDAISGTSTVGRRAFQEMFADAQRSDRPFACVVVYDVKRFGRVDNDEAGYYRHLLKQNGVEVRYVTENFSGDGTDDLLRPVKQWQAREESKDLSKVTIRGLLSKSQSGFWMGGAPPFGYDLRYESQTGRFLLRLRYHADATKGVLDDKGKELRRLGRGESIAVSRKDRCRLAPGEKVRVETVRRVFRMYSSEGRGFKAIADALNRDRVPSARGPLWARRCSGQWAMTTVRAILVNPPTPETWPGTAGPMRVSTGSEKGRAVPRLEAIRRRLDANERSDWIVVKDAHEPIVSRRAWDAAQRIMAEKPASATQRGVNPRTGDAVGGSPAPTGGWTGPRARFLLSGLCTCVRCDSRYEGYTQRASKKDEDGTRRKWHSYACGAAIRRGPSVCRLGLVGQECLENAVVGSVLEHYAPFTGSKGLARLRSAAEESLGGRHADAERDRSAVAKRLEAIKEILRNLLDNLTAANRDAVDERIAELGKEKEQLAARSEELIRRALSEGDFNSMLREAGRFLSGLGVVLAGEALEPRQAAIRRCVRRVWVDAEAARVKIEAFTPPLTAERARAVPFRVLDAELS